jgi:hypothetical protein
VQGSLGRLRDGPLQRATYSGFPDTGSCVGAMILTGSVGYSGECVLTGLGNKLSIREAGGPAAGRSSHSKRSRTPLKIPKEQAAAQHLILMAGFTSLPVTLHLKPEARMTDSGSVG